MSTPRWKSWLSGENLLLAGLVSVLGAIIGVPYFFS
jgi:hypothetical protein